MTTLSIRQQSSLTIIHPNDNQDAQAIDYQSTEITGRLSFRSTQVTNLTQSLQCSVIESS
jgi:hypothetical protein